MKALKPKKVWIHRTRRGRALEICTFRYSGMAWQSGDVMARALLVPIDAASVEELRQKLRLAIGSCWDSAPDTNDMADAAIKALGITHRSPSGGRKGK